MRTEDKLLKHISRKNSLAGCKQSNYVVASNSLVAQLLKESAFNAGDIREVGSIPGLGRSPGEGHGNPLQYSYGESHGQRSLAGYSQ